MQTKPLLYGIIGFLLGGLIVSIAATGFEKPQDDKVNSMVSSLEGKTGDDFDGAFINDMISHHEDAIDMARMANGQAKHQEIKDLSQAIIETQQKEINDMKSWRNQWGYNAGTPTHPEAH